METVVSTKENWADRLSELWYLYKHVRFQNMFKNEFIQVKNIEVLYEQPVIQMKKPWREVELPFSLKTQFCFKEEILQWTITKVSLTENNDSDGTLLYYSRMAV